MSIDATSPLNEEKPAVDLADSIKNFAESLSALREFVELISSVLNEKEKEYIRSHKEELRPIALMLKALAKKEPFTDEDSKRLSDELGGKVSLEKTNEGGAKLTISPHNFESHKRLEAAFGGMRKSSGHKDLLYRSSLISLVSSAEWFLSQVIREHLELNPDAWDKDNKLTFGDLKSLGSIDDARKFLIDMKIDSLMWGGFEDWFRYLTQHAKLSASYVVKNRDQLTEVFQRRNVMVHNNGLVHTSYLNKVDSKLRKDVSIGDPLPVTPDYLSKAIDLIETNFILLAAELWKKLEPKDDKRADVLINLAFDLLKQERWDVSGGLSLFVMNDKNLPEVSQVIGALNYWQSMKWQGAFDKVRRRVEESDFSAKDLVYQVARFALLNQENDFFSLLPKALSAGSLDAEKLRTWPIFKEMRQLPKCQPYLLLESGKTPSGSLDTNTDDKLQVN